MSEIFLASVISSLVAGAGGAFGAWGAVRYELGRTREAAEHAKDQADRANKRLDELKAAH